MALYKNIISKFPSNGLAYVFAYGSAVKQQYGYKSPKNNVVDLVFCVRDALGWHSENMERHPSHYSALRLLGPDFTVKYQENFGAGVYCNTLIPLEELGVVIKYSVVSRFHLLQDLQQWQYLYLAGRLQKPVHSIVWPTGDPHLENALQVNLISAFRMALLLLPERFSSFDLFHTIAGLSYNGDFRMIFGENKNKIHNIVKGQKLELLEIYRPAMQQLTDFVAVAYHTKKSDSEIEIAQFEQDKSPAANVQHLREAPAELQRRLMNNTAFAGAYIDVAEHLSTSHNIVEILQMSLNDIVWISSITQSLKNVPSAGVMKSIVYSYQKALKTFAKC